MTFTTPRETFDRNLKALLNEVLVLGSMVEQAILDSVDALVRRDKQAAQRIYDGDRNINLKRYQIEYQTITLIATQQPMARDLRILAAVLEINTELERIGDYAKGICRINIRLGEESFPSAMADLQKMAELGVGMLHRAVGAFAAKDVETARLIPGEDDEVDNLYNHIFHTLMDQMIHNPAVIDQANYLMWAAHNLERLADRVTNICERIIFVVTGEIMEMDVTDDESIQKNDL